MLPHFLVAFSAFIVSAVTGEGLKELQHGDVNYRQTARAVTITDFDIGPPSPQFGNIVVCIIQEDGSILEDGFLNDVGQWSIFEPDIGLFTATDAPQDALPDVASPSGTLLPVIITCDAGGTLGYLFDATTNLNTLTCATAGEVGFANQDWFNFKFNPPSPDLLMDNIPFGYRQFASAIPTTITPTTIGGFGYPVPNISLLWSGLD